MSIFSIAVQIRDTSNKKTNIVNGLTQLSERFDIVQDVHLKPGVHMQ